MSPLRLTQSAAGFHCSIGEEWLQGRTAYGGASAAMALAAVKAQLPELPPLVSAQLAFVGPLSGGFEARPLVLRQGRNSVFVSCDLIASDSVALRALFLFMPTRASAVEQGATHAPASEVGDQVPYQDPMPVFMRNFDMAEAGPHDAAGWLRWVRLREDQHLDAEVGLMLLADALPPAAMELAPPTGPVSTTTWQVNIVGRPGVTTDWHLLAARSLSASGGTSSQMMSVWNSEGQALATATQSVALFY